MNFCVSDKSVNPFLIDLKSHCCVTFIDSIQNNMTGHCDLNNNWKVIFILKFLSFHIFLLKFAAFWRNTIIFINLKFELTILKCLKFGKTRQSKAILIGAATLDYWISVPACLLIFGYFSSRHRTSFIERIYQFLKKYKFDS